MGIVLDYFKIVLQFDEFEMICPVFKFSMKDIAQQITLLQFDKFRRITIDELCPHCGEEVEL